MKRTSWILCACVALAASAAQADFNLQVTEIWPGNEPGENLTNDWFEVTNLGSMPFVPGVDGDLYFDDDSQDFTTADLMSGYGTIAPGESVVFLDVSVPEEPGDATIAEQVAEFTNLWGAVVTLPQVGTYSGSGLSQGGDGVTLFNDADLDGVEFFDIIDFELYPDAEQKGGQSYDVFLGTFSENLGFSAAMTAGNDVGQPGVGTPGYIVPEPTTLALASLLAGTFATRRRR